MVLAFGILFSFCCDAAPALSEAKCSGAVIIGSLIGLALWAWLLYEIIKAASNGKKIHEEQEIQTFLLIEIARKLGVEEEKINEIAYEDETKVEEFKPQL